MGPERLASRFCAIRSRARPGSTESGKISVCGGIVQRHCMSAPLTEILCTVIGAGRWPACRRRRRRGRRAIMSARERPLPCMRWKGPPGPARHAVRSLGPRILRTRHHRSARPRRTPVDSVPASSEGAFRGGSPVGGPVANSVVRKLTAANSRAPVPAGAGVSLVAGSPSLVACEISIAAERPVQEAGEAIFKILYDGSTRPQERSRYPQVDARCPPVVHQFIHTCALSSRVACTGAPPCAGAARESG
jgi:hypothetical protein